VIFAASSHCGPETATLGADAHNHWSRFWADASPASEEMMVAATSDFDSKCFIGSIPRVWWGGKFGLQPAFEGY